MSSATNSFGERSATSWSLRRVSYRPNTQARQIIEPSGNISNISKLRIIVGYVRGTESRSIAILEYEVFLNGKRLPPYLGTSSYEIEAALRTASSFATERMADMTSVIAASFNT